MWYTKIVHSLLLPVAALLTAAGSTMAQSYEHMPGDTIIATAVFNDVNVFNITQAHPTPDTLYFSWYRQSVVMPASWEASICDNGNCYTSLKDSGMMAPIVPGDNGLMSLHLNPGSEPGTGIIRYRISAHNSPERVDTLTWIITAAPVTGISPLPAQQPLITVQDQQLLCLYPEGVYTTVLLYDMGGRLLYRQRLWGKEARIGLERYSNQLFVLKLTGKRSFITKILNQ